MTSGSPVRVAQAVEIPELGASLGRIPAPPGDRPGLPVPLDPVRLELATAIFELAADARSWSSAGDRQAAIDALGRAGWLAAWEAAVRSAAALMADATDRRIEMAAAESRFPSRKLRQFRLTEAERRALAARLGRGGFNLAEELARLDAEGKRLAEAGVLDRAAAQRWRDALAGGARSLESAWLALEEAAGEEWQRWTPVVESVRRWRRPRWLLWLLSALVVGGFVYVGLVIGGYLEGPAILDRLAEWWYSTWDRFVERA